MMLKSNYKTNRQLLPAVLAAGTVILSSTANAGSLDDCLSAASQIKAGDFVKVEYLNPSAEGIPTYEIEVRAANGRE
jgi:hypothetical protein